MKQERTQPNRNKLNLMVDLAIFAAFLVAMAPRFSGMAVHEWLGMAFAAAIVTHLLLHWHWIVEVTRRLFGKLQWSARINYILNLLLFIDITLVVFSGIMISRSALPLMGITLVGGGSYRGLHEITANLSLVLIGLHVALHWDWIVNMLWRFVLPSRVAKSAAKPALQAEALKGKA